MANFKAITGTKNQIEAHACGLQFTENDDYTVIPVKGTNLWTLVWQIDEAGREIAKAVAVAKEAATKLARDLKEIKSLYAKSTHVPAEIRALLGVSRIPSKLGMQDFLRQAMFQMESIRTKHGSNDVRTAIYGLAHAFQTGRLDGQKEQMWNRLSGKDIVALVQRIIEMSLTGDDVARFLNGRRFTHNGFRWAACYE